MRVQLRTNLSTWVQNLSLEIIREDKVIDIEIERDEEKGYVNNSKQHYKFKFNDVFGMQTS